MFTCILMLPSLPNELVLKILEHVDYKTITACRRVSHPITRVLLIRYTCYPLARILVVPPPQSHRGYNSYPSLYRRTRHSWHVRWSSKRCRPGRATEEVRELSDGLERLGVVSTGGLSLFKESIPIPCGTIRKSGGVERPHIWQWWVSAAAISFRSAWYPGAAVVLGPRLQTVYRRHFCGRFSGSPCFLMVSGQCRISSLTCLTGCLRC